MIKLMIINFIIWLLFGTLPIPPRLAPHQAIILVSDGRAIPIAEGETIGKAISQAIDALPSSGGSIDLTSIRTTFVINSLHDSPIVDHCLDCGKHDPH